MADLYVPYRASPSNRLVTLPSCRDIIAEARCGLTRSAWDRFWEKVDASGDCWEWTAARNPKGYGSFCVKTSKPQRGIGAHRFSWEVLVGPIPEDYTIDHLCRNRSCVNPDHLEPVPHRVNLERGYPGHYERPDRCDKGHLLTPDNIYSRPDRPLTRSCRICQRRRNREYERRYAETNGVWRR